MNIATIKLISVKIYIKLK